MDVGGGGLVGVDVDEGGVVGVDVGEGGGGSCVEQLTMIKAADTKMTATTCFVDMVSSWRGSIYGWAACYDYRATWQGCHRDQYSTCR